MQFENFPERDKFVVGNARFPNPLDPRTAAAQGYTLVQPEKAGTSGNPREVFYGIYFPPALMKAYLAWYKGVAFTTAGEGETFPNFSYPVRVCIFFAAPGDDASIETLGLRFFFKTVADTFFVVVPNYEDRGTGGTHPKNAGVTTDIIKKLIKIAEAVRFRDTKADIKFLFDFTITSCTAYSAGFGGMVQSINNSLIDFKNLERMVFYDCLYRADGPALPAGEKPPVLSTAENNSGPDELDKSHGSSAFNTRRAINRVKAVASKMQTIAYCMSTGGSPKYLQGNKGYTVEVDKLIDLRASDDQRNFLFALSLTRVLHMAKDEGLVTAAEIPNSLKDIYNTTIPARGQIASLSSQMKTSRTGFTPTTNLLDWGKNNKALIQKAQGIFGTASDLVGKKNLFYDGYPSLSNPGGMLHIAQIFEFAWEEFI